MEVILAIILPYTLYNDKQWMSFERVVFMFKNKNPDGSLNICGSNIAALRKASELSQRGLADQLQLLGIDFSKNAIQQIESGERFVTDIELKAIAKFFQTSTDNLLK